MALKTLSDSRALLPLARAAERAGVDIVLFGSVATRALLLDAANIEVRDLFELTEHTTDIDLAHTGPPSATPFLQSAIADFVPMAPWFRWSIVDRDELARMDQLLPFNIKIPLRQLRIGSQPIGDSNSINVILDRALVGKVEIFGNTEFNSSPRSNYDTESSASLLWIDAALDVIEVGLRSRQFYDVEIDASFYELLNTGVERLKNLADGGRDAALRRLWYRLSSIGLRISPSFFKRIQSQLQLGVLLDVMSKAGYPTASFGNDASAVTLISAHLGKGIFRVPLTVGTVDAFGESRNALDAILQVFSERLLSAPIKLSEGNDVIAEIRSIPVNQGISSSSIAKGPLAQEFIYVSLPAKNGELSDISSDELTAVVIAHRSDGPLLIPAFASVSVAIGTKAFTGSDKFDRFVSERCTIRLNLTGMLGGVEKLDIFLVKDTSEGRR